MTDDTFITRRQALARLGAVALLSALPKKLLASDPKKPLPHPDPRPGITAANVLAEDDLPKKKSVREAYEIARTYPEVLDGIYCPCDCSKPLGHRSLLSCFESKQPTGCMGCQDAAEFVGRLAKQGKSLAEIREAVDKKFG